MRVPKACHPEAGEARRGTPPDEVKTFYVYMLTNRSRVVLYIQGALSEESGITDAQIPRALRIDIKSTV